MSAKSYRKKPVVIEAIKWTGKNLPAVTDFIEGRKVSMAASFQWDDYERLVAEQGLTIQTLEGMMKANIGDFIIKGVQGEYYPCKPDIFKQTYELVDTKEQEQKELEA